MSPYFYFCQGFLSPTYQLIGQQRKGRKLRFILLYHFHPLKKIQTFICNFTCEMTITYFQRSRLYLPGCYSMRFITWSNYQLIDWWCDVHFVCSLDDFILGFCYSELTWENCWLDLVSTITLVLQVNRLIQCASHPGKSVFGKKSFLIL